MLPISFVRFQYWPHIDLQCPFRRDEGRKVSPYSLRLIVLLILGYLAPLQSWRLGFHDYSQSSPATYSGAVLLPQCQKLRLMVSNMYRSHKPTSSTVPVSEQLSPSLASKTKATLSEEQLSKIPRRMRQPGLITDRPADADLYSCTLRHGDIVLCYVRSRFDLFMVDRSNGDWD